MSDEEKKEEMQFPVCQTTGELVPKGPDQFPTKQLLNDGICRRLIKEAIAMLERSYAPYSGFHVGAALLAKNNKIYTGCNIENATFTPTICAERTAISKAISEGETKFTAIAVVGGKEGVITDFCPPCGVCRQVMMEFCNPLKFIVIVARSEQDYMAYTLAEMLPFGFSPKNLE